MELQYENITIRNAAVTDAELLARWWNDGGVMAHAGYPNGLGTTARKVAGQIRQESDSTVRRYMILLDGVRVGEMVHRQINPRVCEIGIKICQPEKQNQGYGKKFSASLFPVCLTAWATSGSNWIPLWKIPGPSTSMRAWAFRSLGSTGIPGLTNWVSAALRWTMG